MSLKIEKQKTQSTPYVLIDEEKAYLKLQGESFMEDVIIFYKEINEWLGKFLEKNFSEFTFDCALEYFNSSTTIQLYNMLQLIDKHANGKKVVINWIISDKEDNILIECGEDFKDDLKNVEFNIIK